MAVFAQFQSYRCAVMQSCGCHHRAEFKKKLGLQLVYLLGDKIITSELGRWIELMDRDGEPGCWVIPDFGHCSKILCASDFFYMEIRIFSLWIKCY